MRDEFRLVVASPPDREGLVTEIWCGEDMWAEVAGDRDRLSLEIYPKRAGEPWRFDLEKAVDAIRLAAREQLSRGG